jgi:hypothetical protein
MVLTYPLSSAIGTFLKTGSVDGLAALSVQSIIDRPWLRTDPSVAPQLALPVPQTVLRGSRPSRTITNAIPEVTLSGLPSVGTLDSNIGAGNVLFCDAHTAVGAYVPARWRYFSPIEPVLAPNTFVKATDGWVDARLAFLERPELAQAFGGAMTANSTALLPVRPGRDTLVHIDGQLADANGRLIARNTPGYRWIPLPTDTRAVRCTGICVIAAQATIPQGLPLNPPTNPYKNVPFHVVLPWLALARIPPGEAQLLRYNVAFASGWDAILDGTTLPHVRIDGIVNGWIIPPRTSSVQVTLIEHDAALIMLAECLAAAGSLVLVVRTFLDSLSH